MDAETLSLLRELQPKIRECMGPLQVGDAYYCPRSRPGKPLSVIEIDPEYPDDSTPEVCCPDVVIMVPDAISRDPDRPSRGLWGMIDWTKFNSDIDRDGEISTGFGHDSAYHALLRALAYQVKEEAQR